MKEERKERGKIERKKERKKDANELDLEKKREKSFLIRHKRPAEKN